MNPSSTTVPSITKPKVSVPPVEMKSVKGFTLVFPNSGSFSNTYNVNTSRRVDVSSGSKGVAGSSPIEYISHYYFYGDENSKSTDDTTITMTGVANGDNTYTAGGVNRFYGGGSRFAYVDDVRNADGSKRVLSSPGSGKRITFTLLNKADINLTGPAIAGIVNEETSFTDGDTTTNITNSGSINDERENLSGTFLGTIRKNVDGTLTENLSVTANQKGKTGYKVGIAQTTEETIDYKAGTYYELFNGSNGGSSTFFDAFDTYLRNAINNVNNAPNFSVATSGKNTNIAGSTFSSDGVIHFSGDYSTGIQVASALRPNANRVDPVKYSNNTSRSLVRADNKENGYIQLDGSHSYGMKLSGTALHVDNNDYAPTSLASYVANNGLILISGSYDTAINNVNAEGSSAGMAKLKEAKWSSENTIFNNGKIYVGGYNNSGILLESIFNDKVTNTNAGDITIDQAYNLFNNPNSSITYSNAVARNNAGIRVQSYKSESTDDKALGNPEGINKGIINIKNGTDNVGIYVLDEAGTIHDANGKELIGNNTGKIYITGGDNIGMMAQDKSGTNNFKTIIKNSNLISVAGNGSIGMYTADKDSYAEQNDGSIKAYKNNIGVVNLGHFDFKKGTISADGINSVGVYSKTATSNTTLGSGTLGDTTLTVTNGGVGLYADDSSTQKLSGLTANVSGSSTALISAPF